MKNIIYLLLFISMWFCGCVRQTNHPLPKVTLRQEWFPNSNYCGAVFAKENFAEKNGIELEIVQGAENVNPITMVYNGDSDFGDAGADLVLKAIDKGYDLVVVGVVNIDTPTCFVSKKEKNIRTPSDFEGHKIGVLTGTNTEYVYRALIKKLKIDRKRLQEIEIPFDLGTFIADQYDVRPAFIYDEPVSLDLQDIKYNIIEPKDYGISFLGTVYFTTRTMIKENPELVQAFVNSVADGWKAALKYPEEAIELLAKEYSFNPDDAKREMLSLEKGIGYLKGKDEKILWADLKDWTNMINILRDLREVGNIPIAQHIDNTFLENYYKQVDEKK